ncbi:MAG TPA: hypothetical protein P5110_00820 [Candidatus Omnitrophota bacterium]|nr:hypothetical protein [Candidatus Omnitrophota bacterium]
MKRIITGICVWLLLCAVAALAEEAEMPAALPPTVTEIKGAQTAELSPARYPVFKSFPSGDAPTCQAYLSTLFDEEEATTSGEAQSGLSLAPIQLTSKFGSPGVPAGDEARWEPVQGLKLATFTVPSEYRKTAKILITWTVRVNGIPTALNIRPNLCSNWAGTSVQGFPEGQLITKLYINKIPTSKEVEITVPASSDLVISQPRPPAPTGCDPTLTGSYLISPDQFSDKQLPAKLTNIEIWWKNDTSMKLVSEGDWRNMIITFMPLGKDQN